MVAVTSGRQSLLVDHCKKTNNFKNCVLRCLTFEAILINKLGVLSFVISKLKVAEL